MSVPVRPTKSTGGIVYVAGADILAAELNGDYDALDTAVRNIDSTNLAASPNFPGTAIADAPAGIPTAKLNNDTIIIGKVKRQEVVITPTAGSIFLTAAAYINFDLSLATPATNWSATGFFSGMTYMFLGLCFENTIDNAPIANGTYGRLTANVSRSGDGTLRTFLTIMNNVGTTQVGSSIGFRIRMWFMKDA